MKSRCNNPNTPEYHRYGGRGITVCKEWENSYIEFRDWAYDNGYNPNLPRGVCTIDRIDNDKGYCPENCRWVSQKEQMNNVSYNHYETLNGETHTLAEWAKIYNVPYYQIINRLRNGYDIESALT